MVDRSGKRVARREMDQKENDRRGQPHDDQSLRQSADEERPHSLLDGRRIVARYPAVGRDRPLTDLRPPCIGPQTRDVYAAMDDDDSPRLRHPYGRCVVDYLLIGGGEVRAPRVE